MERENWQFWGVVAFLYVAGVILIIRPGPLENNEVVLHFGIAFLISAVLATTVDLYAKRRMLREVSKDVFQYIVGYSLPIELQERIKLLITTKLVREDMVIVCSLSRLPNRPGMVRADVSVRYFLKNLSRAPQPFKQEYRDEAHGSPRVSELRCDCDDTRSQYHRQAGPAENLASTKEGDPGVLESLGPEIQIPAGARYPFGIKYSVVYPEEWSDVFSFGSPTIGVVFEADYPDDMDLKISPRANVGVTPRRWEFHGLFLPDEHIRYRWYNIPR